MASLFSRRSPLRRATRLLALAILVISLVYILCGSFSRSHAEFKLISTPIRPELFPVQETLQLPRNRAARIPKIQHAPVVETRAAKALREARLAEVRETFLHAWNGYKKEAWAQDELKPVNGGYKTPFCGWAATLIDSLDTLLIMELYDEFELALEEVAKVDFTGTEGCQINLFEVTIRHLGGLISAFDLSGGKRYILIEKAVELAEVLFTAFDTPNRMPTPHYKWSATDSHAHNHEASGSVCLAVIGSLTLEFTRLSQITGNDKYYDGVQRIMNELEKWQPKTTLPGMWPSMVDSTLVNQTIALASPARSRIETYSLGALADSAFEYLPKQYLMLGGRVKQYRTMYEDFVEVAKEHLIFRPMTIGDKDILLSGDLAVNLDGDTLLTPNMQHLSCFVGGMLAISGKIFNRPEDVADGKRYTDGCVWAYQNTPSGIMPETFTAVPCANKTSCPWDEELWLKAVDQSGTPENARQKINSDRLPPGFAQAHDRRYLLRPEAIESVFILWRVTGDQHWAESGWDMFKAIQATTTTEIAHSAIDNVLNSLPSKTDEMESFWTAETLKYFYLLYSDTDVINLDNYIFNTEAHPLKRVN